MALRYWAFIYKSPGFDPEKNVAVMESPACRMKAIGVDMAHPEQAIEAAKTLVAEGVQAIELCGGFGPVWVAKISEAIGNAVPVGTVVYGPEHRKALLDIMT
jgi:uncharacterized protein DUF6506